MNLSVESLYDCESVLGTGALIKSNCVAHEENEREERDGAVCSGKLVVRGDNLVV